MDSGGDEFDSVYVAMQVAVMMTMMMMMMMMTMRIVIIISNVTKGTEGDVNA